MKTTDVIETSEKINERVVTQGMTQTQKPRNTSLPEEWEVEFDNNFGGEFSLTLENPFGHPVTANNEVKQFIRTLLVSQRKAWREKILALKEDINEKNADTYGFHKVNHDAIVHNEALHKVLSLLEES